MNPKNPSSDNSNDYTDCGDGDGDKNGDGDKRKESVKSDESEKSEFGQIIRVRTILDKLPVDHSFELQTPRSEIQEQSDF